MKNALIFRLFKYLTTCAVCLFAGTSYADDLCYILSEESQVDTEACKAGCRPDPQAHAYLYKPLPCNAECSVVIQGDEYISGDCFSQASPNNQLVLTSADGYWMFHLDHRQDGRTEGYWNVQMDDNGEPIRTRYASASMGLLSQIGECWRNAEHKICVYTD
ncbi:hypothetical protein [Yoonia maritima]|uniref:hypothetical protein n=1 Tax=Yoonia maritima TaxID=1435347 RepID=UPI0037368C6B